MKYYFIYQIKNKINNKIYIGKHITDNPNDDYMGSGVRIQRAIKKYGIENFEKTILFECSSKEEMDNKEAEIVNEEFLKRDDVYNLKLGGEGGWDYLNSSKSGYGAGTEKRHNAAMLAVKNTDKLVKSNNTKKMWEKVKANQQQFEQYKKNISAAVKQFHKDNPGIHAGKNNPMYGKTFSDETKKHLSEIKIGDKNPMHGKIWICNYDLEESKIWNIADPIPEGWVKGRHSKKQFSVIKQNKINQQNKKLKQLQDKEAKLQLYREMYKEFKENDFIGVVKKFGYTKTRNNLVMTFKSLIPEYIPNVCNRWKNNINK